MHKLGRQVRFSINPFLPNQNSGANSFASKPCGEGLSIFFELGVELAGNVHRSTGFVVNVIDIDKNIRKYVVPLFSERIQEAYRRSRHVKLWEMIELLKSSWGQLVNKFSRAKISNLSLNLNPFRKLTIDSEDCKMFYFSEKFEFAATHKLWNKKFSEKQNIKLFGKCANPSGHGHNYVVEVTVKVPQQRNNFHIGDFENTVNHEFAKLVDHKNLNTDLAEFHEINPTVENIAAFAWNRLVGRFNQAILHCVTVWETDKTYCSYHNRNVSTE